MLTLFYILSSMQTPHLRATNVYYSIEEFGWQEKSLQNKDYFAILRPKRHNYQKKAAKAA